MVSNDELRKKRVFVGLLGVACLVAGGGLQFVAGHDALQAALIRVGMLLGAFWLALPTKERPAAWANVSGLKLVIIVAVIVLVSRLNLKFALPVLLGGVALGWLVRPRRRDR